MDVQKLTELCEDRVASGLDWIVLVIPRKATGNKIRFLRSRGPLGEILNSTENQTVAGFKASKILKFIEKSLKLEKQNGT